MSKTIRHMYTSKGIKPPKGKGIHTAKAHKMVSELEADGMPRSQAWATTMKKLGRDQVVKKSHRR